jgi:hypothetical protein
VPERIKEMSLKIFSVQIFVLYPVWYNLNAMGLERSQIGDQPALHVEAEGAIMVILPGS